MKLFKNPIKTGDLNYICKNELDKACFAHNTVYANSNNLAKRTVLEKVLRIEILKLH